ncbi:13522_t:CDS:2 [Ambispora gerdemannii]|uniref:13522_t:CDS:1 n=1 Tax=Ambispora gerdemannii TaxID=144530 RepID=A0A9N8V8J7_9GLOM|nr:13522_t:CDS:2 [Ambispora gerdemannii]
MERAVRGATKSKSAAPKEKYLQVLLAATSDDALEEIFTTLHYRVREHSWSIVFKSLIVIHILIRQGAGNKALSYLLSKPTTMNVSKFRDKSGSHHVEQTKNIHAYAAYLEERVAAYRELKLDFLKERSQSGTSGSRLRRLTVAKGLLREVKILQRQLGALLKCKVFLDEVDNEVTLTAFRLLVKDLLELFQVVNEGVINVLEQYVEMSLVDAKDALEIYRTFVKQTELVVDYLSVARKLQSALGMSIPNLKHAPVSMTVFLEEYINDPDFEKNRQEYKLSKNSADTKKVKDKTVTTTSSPTTTATATRKSVDLNKSTNEVVSSENITNSMAIFVQDTNPFRSLYSQSSTTNSSTSAPIGTIGTSISPQLNQTNPFTAITTTNNTATTIDNNQLFPLGATTDSNPFRRFTRSLSFNAPQPAIATFSGSPSSFPDSNTSSIVPYQPFHANTMPFRTPTQHRQSAANIFSAEY